MKKILLIYALITFNIIFSQNDERDNSLKKSNDLMEIEKELTENSTLVKVINTCSTNPDWCGTLAFGSSSLVEILEGKYKNKLIFVSALCFETNYENGKSYLLKVTKSPDFGLGLCNDEFYDRKWTENNTSKKLPMIFGVLQN